LNILNNGAHAMSEKLTRKSDYKPKFILRISNEFNTGMLKIEIEDNGHGMDAETRDKVFEPFFTTKPVGIGTGLGLSVSYFIITDHHKGTLEVESEPDKGTNFIIRLPIEKKINHS
jgi:signal transduction histidine kinase